jgi:hypothetical protein
MNIFDRVIDGDRLRKLHEGEEKFFRVNMEIRTTDTTVTDEFIESSIRSLIGGKYELEIDDITVAEINDLKV